MDELVFITGDQTIDWVFMESDSSGIRHDDERLRARLTVGWHAGGVTLLESLVKESITTRATVKCAYSKPNKDEIRTYDNPYNHTFALMAKGERNRARIKDYLGFRESGKPNAPERPPGPAKVVVIDDAALSFRKDPRNWKGLIPNSDCSKEDQPWVVLKMSQGVMTGKLWDYIYSRVCDSKDWLGRKLIIITSVARLRDVGAGISKDLSWERSAQDVAVELQRNAAIKPLARCGQVVVSFGPSGVLLIKRKNGQRDYTLVFNRELMESEWEEAHSEGMMFGYGSALCAGIVRQLLADPEELTEGILQGVAAMRLIYDDGFDVSKSELAFPSDSLSFAREADRARVLTGFGISRISASTAVESYATDSILGIQHHDQVEVEALAHRVVIEGPSVLDDIPLGHFGKLFSVSRQEIESLHSIRNLLMDYGSKSALDVAPLSIAVFGAPGAGKSYAVKQLMAPLERPGRGVQSFDFNLSQFNSASDLIGALHRVRDGALQGSIPLAFWDEFDSPLKGEHLGWLRYFLAPMQDGKFLQGEIVHRVGPALFVFAGGTSDRFDEFRDAVQKADPDAKALDFLSRLRGFIDVTGPNPEGPGDVHYVLRRAIILHELLKKKGIVKDKRGRFEVSEDVIRAFLTTPDYLHGARSMRAIVEMSRVTKGEHFKVSCLPEEKQLNLHVPGAEFLGRARRRSPDIGFLPFSH
ncbi:ATP-binding protein [Streptomyces sp. UNOB3_S3]|uniref:ATP-binding protein n=1 Tax=Streptomyces sp. UNOB3_S3 TaxID=2871682 RepID=UPI001E449E84|nr:ATP-binding protein [Streptomyces sp. UNOB3_S3]MCC3773504.1 ATP-binding protein [Streptomyces sp. UNOB3_S3]